MQEQNTSKKKKLGWCRTNVTYTSYSQSSAFSVGVLHISGSGADLGFVGPVAYTILGAFFKKNSTKLGTKSEHLFRVTPRSWKGP
jgi:hypothetical protein